MLFFMSYYWYLKSLALSCAKYNVILNSYGILLHVLCDKHFVKFMDDKKKNR